MNLKKKTRGQLIVLSGPSGVGKSTVISELLSERENIRFLHHPPATGGRGGRRQLQFCQPGAV